MNWKAWLPLGIAIVLGLLAARVAMNLVSERQSGVISSEVQLTPVVMAAGDIPAGTCLTEKHIKMGKVESSNVPVGAFTDPQSLIGRVTKITLSMNQPIVPGILAEKEAGVGIGATLPEGMRAITVEINDVSGVAGFIQPTCRVDVVGTLQDNGKSIAKTILENIQVLAVGSRTGPEQPVEQGQPVEPARTITLLCTPEQAEKLELASSSTRVRLVLRNGEDKTTLNTPGVTLADLKGKSDDNDPFVLPEVTLTSGSLPTTLPVAQQTGQKRQWTVEIIRAGTTSKQTFEIEPRTSDSETVNTQTPFGPVTGGVEIQR
ncbi:MAG: hypothetical protein KatS3mg104_2239 [Phycisphaerae bacterium]|jgi:pilus assembly protein CpaB|nr:MAG: hypothetical protein KatS3mg104_2239 [Phycisphaerae bacterium]